jgi:hypothetical protein
MCSKDINNTIEKYAVAYVWLKRDYMGNRTIPKSRRKLIETETISIHPIHICGYLLNFKSSQLTTGKQYSNGIGRDRDPTLLILHGKQFVRN